MSDRIGWGILGAGSIARKFATDLKNLEDARLVAVGSRLAEKAAAFASEYDVERFYRDAKTLELIGGNTVSLKNTIARDVIGRIKSL